MILKKVEIPRCPHFKTRKRSLQFSLAKLQVLIIIQGVSFRFLEKNHNNWRSPSLPWNKNIYAFHPQKLEWNQHPFDPEWSQANRWPRPHLIPSPIHEDSTEAWAVTGHKRVMNHKGTKIISKGSCRGKMQTIIEEIKKRSDFELCFVKFPDGRILSVVNTPLAEWCKCPFQLFFKSCMTPKATSHRNEHNWRSQMILPKTCNGICVSQVGLNEVGIVTHKPDGPKGWYYPSMVWTGCNAIAWPWACRSIGTQIPPVLSWKHFEGFGGLELRNNTIPKLQNVSSSLVQVLCSDKGDTFFLIDSLY